MWSMISFPLNLFTGTIERSLNKNFERIISKNELFEIFSVLEKKSYYFDKLRYFTFFKWVFVILNLLFIILGFSFLFFENFKTLGIFSIMLGVFLIIFNFFFVIYLKKIFLKSFFRFLEIKILRINEKFLCKKNLLLRFNSINNNFILQIIPERLNFSLRIFDETAFNNIQAIHINKFDSLKTNSLKNDRNILNLNDMVIRYNKINFENNDNKKNKNSKIISKTNTYLENSHDFLNSLTRNKFFNKNIRKFKTNNIDNVSKT